MFVQCECLIHNPLSLTRDWECSTKTSAFWATSLEKGNKWFVFVPKAEKCSICNRRPCFGSVRNAHLTLRSFGKLREKRYSSSLKVVKETVRKCRISAQKSWCIESDIRNFRDKNGDAWKSFDFFDTQIKTPSGSDYACSRESTLRSVPLLPLDAIRSQWKIVMQILY